ncbi:hypothetical protein FQ192_11800 [Pseudomonas sp. ANT_J12]|uniref:hypothetical protein n=1 Tax=Pseudomonas sp. ANT_J12 TaxID=2597351 RepID=UPI0011F34372|nr:hypothetical protein [Pseudomonas sp. ANT_J12]KAA0994807.1 hypothetical protein FQ192_11800 [Pseudomonas sp. ANT_J12]
MKNIDDLKKRIAEELQGYNIYFSPESVPESIEFPVAWRNFGFVDGKSSRIPDTWDLFAERLPWVTSWLDKCVLGTFLAVSDKPYLLYVYCEDDELNFYIGGVPIEGDGVWSGKLAYLNGDLKQFYRTLHDGFGFYIGCTMGPSRAEDFVWIEDLCDEAIPSLPTLVGFFSSGAGDYLAVELKSSADEAYIWWHEKPEFPDKNINMWDVMDAWMSIFLENSDSNEIMYV